MYKGIDYSMGKANVDKETGIHYGVINQKEISEVWFDDSSPILIPFCPSCGEQIASNMEAIYEMEYCPNCGLVFDDSTFEYIEPSGFEYQQDGYVCLQLEDDTDIFIVKSPYFTYCQFCSPCAPGAGYIMNTVKDGVKTYCLGHDWFENGEAPYPVYDVETGEEVLPITE